MASFCSVRFVVQKRVFMIQRPNAVYFSAFSTKCDIRSPYIASQVGYCSTWAFTKRNFSTIYFKKSSAMSVLFIGNLQTRFESTTPVNAPKEEQSKFQQFKKILYDFSLGLKELYKDVRGTLKIRRKLKVNDWNYSVLSRKEQWTMFKTQKSLRKTLPIAVWSCLPMVGYSGPVIGFLRPRQFLSHHFWTAKQKKRFPVLDNKERSLYRDKLLKDIKGQMKEYKDPENYSLLHRLAVEIDQNFEPNTNNDSLAFLPIFSTGIFKLENLAQGHLGNLCLFWQLSSWLPKSLIQNRLRKEIITIHKDDSAILREGVHMLSKQEIQEACHVRGLDTTGASSEELGKWLQDWVELSTRVPESETSFLAHQAVFKTFAPSFHQTDISQKRN